MPRPQRARQRAQGTGRPGCTLALGDSGLPGPRQDLTYKQNLEAHPRLIKQDR